MKKIIAIAIVCILAVLTVGCAFGEAPLDEKDYSRYEKNASTWKHLAAEKPQPEKVEELVKEVTSLYEATTGNKVAKSFVDIYQVHPVPYPQVDLWVTLEDGRVERIGFGQELAVALHEWTIGRLEYMIEMEIRPWKEDEWIFINIYQYDMPY